MQHSVHFPMQQQSPPGPNKTSPHILLQHMCARFLLLKLEDCRRIRRPLGLEVAGDAGSSARSVTLSAGHDTPRAWRPDERSMTSFAGASTVVVDQQAIFSYSADRMHSQR